MHRIKITVLMMFLLLMGMNFNPDSDNPDKITIATASSLTLPMEEIEKQFERRYNVRVDLISAFSGGLDMYLLKRKRQVDMDFSWEPFILSIQLTFVTTAMLLALGLPISYLIFFHGSGATPVLKSLVSLPLVLPPTVIGYYLLVAFRPEGNLGILSQAVFGTDLVFSFTGLVIGSVIFSFPFMVNPALSALENLPSN